MRRQVMSKNGKSNNIDEVDLKIIGLLTQDKSNQQISLQLDIPLSTVQRRTRKVKHSGLVKNSTQIDYESLGFNTGLAHIYLNDGDIDQTAKKVYELDGITYVEIHIGNSDILGNVVYKNGKELLNTISTIKKIKGIEKVVWSERVYRSPTKQFQKIGNFLNR